MEEYKLPKREWRVFQKIPMVTVAEENGVITAKSVRGNRLTFTTEEWESLSLLESPNHTAAQTP